MHVLIIGLPLKPKSRILNRTSKKTGKPQISQMTEINVFGGGRAKSMRRAPRPDLFTGEEIEDADENERIGEGFRKGSKEAKPGRISGPPCGRITESKQSRRPLPAR